MSVSVHVLVRCVLGSEFLSTHLASEARHPMIFSFYMLIASTLGHEGVAAGLAFWPVIIEAHVLVAVFLVPECARASLAFIHLEGLIQKSVFTAIEVIWRNESLGGTLEQSGRVPNCC